MEPLTQVGIEERLQAATDTWAAVLDEYAAAATAAAEAEAEYRAEFARRFLAHREPFGGDGKPQAERTCEQRAVADCADMLAVRLATAATADVLRQRMGFLRTQVEMLRSVNTNLRGMV